MAKKTNKSKLPPASGVSIGSSGGGLEFFFRQRGKVLLLCALLFGVVVWTFFPSLKGEFMFYDEYGYLLTNSHVNSGLNWENFFWALGSLNYSNWYPLTWVSDMLDFQLYGPNPWGHHLTNVLLHAANAVLLFLVLRKMTGALWRSFLVAALFALHPLRVESVAWISERKDVLSTLFWLLAMWAYVRFAEEFRAQSGKLKFFYGLTLVFFVLGLMCKTMLVTLPCVFLLLDYWPLDRWKLKSKPALVLEKIPFFLLALAVSKISYVAQVRGGSLQEMANLSMSARWENAVVSYARYLGKFFWPADLCVYYPHPGFWPIKTVLLAGLLLVGVSFFAWLMRRRAPYLFVGWFWYVGTLVPVIGLVQLCSQSMADRYTYVPMIGIAFLLVWGLHALTVRWRHQVVVLSAAGAVLTFVCVVRTRQEIGFWKDGVTLWNRAIAVTKNNYVAHNNLGLILGQTDSDGALAEFQEAVNLNPDYDEAQRNLAQALHQRGRLDEAVVHYQAAWDNNPTDSRPQYGLAIISYQKGNVDEAIVHFQKALSINPDNLEYLNKLAMLLAQKNRFAEAVAPLKKICEIQTNDPDAFNNLGFVLVKSGRLDEGLSAFQKALNLAPGFTQAQNNLAEALNAKQQSETLSVPSTNQPASTNR
jgi:Flp pilus assembly protein TadD